MGKKVIIAMSGGVDSSVAAYLLKKQGFEVVGAFLCLFKARNSEIKVKRIAKFLKIPLIIIDVRREFKKKVIDYFIGEYEAGRTPNPCTVCNREIKFRFLFEELAKMKADFVATGHYARIISNFQFPISNKIPKSQKSIFKLFEAKDKLKDQSYFLYTLNQKQLAKILFPLGNYKKEEIKKLAEKFDILHLSSADDKCRYEESQGVCFISDKWPDEFLRRNIKMKPGNIVEINRNKVEINGDNIGRHRNMIGRHRGLPLYTIGQRRNIRIGGTGPYYVAQKNFRKNELTVVKNFNDSLLYEKELLVEGVNWTSGKPRFPLKVKICIRYHHPATRAIIKLTSNKQPTTDNNSYKVEFSKPQRAVTPGQAAVFYTQKGEVLGGGTITN